MIILDIFYTKEYMDKRHFPKQGRQPIFYFKNGSSSDIQYLLNCGNLTQITKHFLKIKKMCRNLPKMCTTVFAIKLITKRISKPFTNFTVNVKCYLQWSFNILRAKKTPCTIFLLSNI